MDKDKDTSEIAKLTERIAKDPKSKLFVPLAEEYKKIGDSAKAVAVLREGLKNNPGYVTARSFLGRLLMETGDLAGAQRELEEVIKAIPDNLLAQRKLGDLYVFQGRSGEALQRYKAALALNPGDKDLGSFVADIESGKDISNRIVRPKAAPLSATPGKPAPAPAAAPKTPVTPAAPSQARPAAQTPPAGPRLAAAPAAPAPVTEQPQRTKPAPEPAPASSPQVQKPQAVPEPPKPIPAAPVAAAKVEEIVQEPTAALTPPTAAGGETVAVEGLAGMEPLQQLAAEAAALQEERRSPPRPSSTQQAVPAEPPADAFDLNEPAAEPLTFGDEPQALEWAPPAEPAPNLTAEVKTGEAGDDINTDTLAELYTSQSFYEKAIEIYERMLSERPGTRALEQKLERLRSLAAAAERTGTAFSLSADAAQTVPAKGPGEYLPPASLADELLPEEAVPFPETPVQAVKVPAERPKAESMTEGAGSVPPVADRPSTARSDSLKAMQEALEGAERHKPSLMPAAEQGAGRAPQSATVRRKETIDRLELWLKNVMKEKPQ